MREHFEIPTFEEITVDVAGSRYFSVLDASRGFWQIELTKEASILTTFATPFGRFRFLRLPFGLSSAPEIFHRKFSEIFGDIRGVKIYIDDIIIYAKTEEEHDAILSKVLTRARECGIKFNKNKCQFRVTEVKYVGHILTKEGIKADPDKVEAIKRIPVPTNVQELSRFMGMVTYLARFIPNLSNKNSNLRNLLKKNNQWLWTEQHTREFNDLKGLLGSTPVLQYFDRNKPIVLSVDASKNGLGAVLLQEGGPVAYASKSLSDSQQRYAQIEKEMLAIAFGCQRFYQYLYACDFVVESDHKPLEIIFKKPLERCPLRLQRLRITLQNYTFKVVYKPGSKLYVADTLSRASYNDTTCDINEEEINAQIHLINYYDISPKKYEQIKFETERDEELLNLKEVVRQGWPDCKRKLRPLVAQYWMFRDELVEIEGIVFRGNRVVIPKSLRKDTIDKLHYNHMGIEKTILRATELVFWPGMNKEITDVVNNCPACLKFQNANQEETLVNREIPKYPWYSVAADLFHLDGEEYLLLVDTYSKFPEFFCLGTNTTHNRVIETIESVFARHGKPKILYSGNDVQFVNSHFQLFLKNWEIEHRTSSPRNPKSNGFIERHVQTIKKLLKKALFDGKNKYLTLLEYRNTPLGRGIPSPAQLLFGRRLQGVVPMKEDLLKPEFVKCNYEQILKDKQYKQKVYHDRYARDLRPLVVGDLVMIHIDDKVWEPGKVVAIDKNRVKTYMVKLNCNNRIYVRNRKYLRRFDVDNFPAENCYEEIFDHYYSSKQKPNSVVTVDNNSNECDTESIRHTPCSTHDQQGQSNTNNENGQRQAIQKTVKPKAENTEEQHSVTRSGRVSRKPAYFKDYV